MAPQDYTIHITHYINPHCFYYKLETATMQEHEQAKFAAAFNEHCETEYGIIYDTVRNSQSGKEIQPGDLVALRSNQLQRWLRCEVDELTVDLNQTTWYYLWAIDEGIPIKSHIKYVRPLPAAFRQEPAHAKRGAIMNILPGEMQFDYFKDEQILEPTTKWSPGIVTTLELLLQTAESITFVPNDQLVLQNETIYVGHLYITSQTNVSHNVAAKLRQACPGQMIFTECEKFFKEIEYLRALPKKRYLNNDGFDNHVVNNFITQQHVQESYEPRNHAYMDTQTDTKVSMKVYEWLRQNKEARIALLEQQKAGKDPMKKPQVAGANKHIGRATQETDRTTQMTDHPFPTHGVSGDSKPSKLINNIKRHQARMKSAQSGCPSIASDQTSNLD